MKFQDNIPIYVQIANDIKEQIVSDELKEEDKLLSIREYSVKYSVTALTMQRALALLETEGVIKTKKGVGSFVMKDIQKILKQDMVTKEVEAFVEGLKRIGLSSSEIIILVKEALENDN